MACPTCDHTMALISENPPWFTYHCPRCGTVVFLRGDRPEAVCVPAITRAAELLSERLGEVPEKKRKIGFVLSPEWMKDVLVLVCKVTSNLRKNLRIPAE